MSDVSFAIEAKSDQLNTLDIVGVEPILKITSVTVKDPGSEQPIWVHFEGDHGKPWKPSKGMLRMLVEAWRRDSSNWIGKYVQVYVDPEVKWAGKPVGGIRIRALSDIPDRGMTFIVAENRATRKPTHIPMLTVKEEVYPADKFGKALPVMGKKMQAGEMTLQQVIAQCQKTGQLTAEQLSQLEEAAPVEINNSDDESEEM